MVQMKGYLHRCWQGASKGWVCRTQQHDQDGGCRDTGRKCFQNPGRAGAQRGNTVIEKVCSCCQRQDCKTEKEQITSATHSLLQGLPLRLPQERAGHPGDVAYKASPRHRAGPKSGNGSCLDVGRTQHAGSPIGMELQSFKRTYPPTFT